MIGLDNGTKGKGWLGIVRSQELGGMRVHGLIQTSATSFRLMLLAAKDTSETRETEQNACTTRLSFYLQLSSSAKNKAQCRLYTIDFREQILRVPNNLSPDSLTFSANKYKYTSAFSTSSYSNNDQHKSRR